MATLLSGAGTILLGLSAYLAASRFGNIPVVLWPGVIGAGVGATPWLARQHGKWADLERAALQKAVTTRMGQE